jgi:glycosyltransferase involved in cell wall biosynthesis
MVEPLALTFVITMKRSLVILTTGLDFGGAETQLVRIATKLRSRGWQVHIVSMLQPRAFEIDLAEAGITVETLAMQRGVPSPSAFIQLCRSLWASKPDVLLSFMVHANIMARLARIFYPVPLLVCSARSVLEQSSRGSTYWRDLAYRITDRLCDITVQNSEAGRKRYVSVGAARKDKITVIPNGLDLQRFRSDPTARADIRRELEADESTFIWLAVGRLEEEKDYPLMFRAFMQAAKGRRACLVVVGKGSQQASLEQLADEVGISAAVRFYGVTNNVTSLMAAADALVLSSAWEGLPNVLIEAAAMELPCVTTDVGGSAEVVVDGATGIVVQGRDPADLAAALERIMKLDRDQLREMGKRARSHAQRSYEIDAVVDQWETVLGKAFV